MRIKSFKKPILGKSIDNDEKFSNWIDVSGLTAKYLGDKILLSVSPNATIQITDRNKKKFILKFFICRFVQIINSGDLRGKKIFIIKFNKKDLKLDSEFPESDKNESLK